MLGAVILAWSVGPAVDPPSPPPPPPPIELAPTPAPGHPDADDEAEPVRDAELARDGGADLGDSPQGPAAELREGEPLEEDAGYTRAVKVETEIRIPTMAPSATLDQEALERTRGEGLADALTGVAGVTTLRASTGMAKPIIRGQVGRRNLILFDGVRHQGQKWGIDHAPEVDPQAAGRITVVKGAGTTRFGPDAIGGVVIVDPRTLRYRPGMNAEVGTVGYSNPLGGGGFARIDMAHRKLEGFAWRVDGNVARHRAAVAPDYPLDNTGSLTWNAGGRMGYRADPFELTVSYRRMQVAAGICSCLRVSTPEEFEQATSLGEPVGAELFSAEARLERPRQEYSHDIAIARSRIGLRDAGDLHLTYAFQLNHREEFDTVRSSVTGPQLLFDLATHTADVHFDQAPVPLRERLSLVGVAGADVNGQFNAFESAQTLIPDYQQAQWGAYVVERLVHPRAELEVAGRYDGLYRVAELSERDYLGQDARGRLDEEACERTADGGGRCEKPFHTGSASVGALVRPALKAPPLSLRADLSSSARIPAIDEQYMNGAAPSFPILGLGDSRLGVERTWGGTFTVQFDEAIIFAEASGFASYTDDYIYFAGAPQEGDCAPLSCTIRGPFPVYEFSAVDAFFGGGEVVVKHRMPRLPFEVGGDAAWVRGYDLGGRRALSFIPADRYRVSGRYLWPDTEVSRDGSLGLEVTFVDRARAFDRDTDFADPPPGYVLLGASTGVDFPVQAHVFKLSLSGGNLTNTRYREYTSLLRYFADEPGWTVQLRFSVELDVDRGPGWQAERSRRRAQRRS